MNLIFGLIVTSLSLIGLHYLPYPKRLHAIGNYVLGVGAIFIGMMIWNGDLTMWAFPVCGGATVVLCYGYDHWLNLRVRAAIYESEHHRVSK